MYYQMFFIEVSFILMVLYYAYYTYQGYFKADVNYDKFEELDLDSKCRDYLSGLKVKVRFHYSAMISAICVILIGILLLLVQIQFEIISTPVYMFILIIIGIVTFAVPYKVNNCMVSRTICEGTNCKGELEVI